MPINKSREDLPRNAGMPPSTEPVIIEKFAEIWLRELLGSGYDEFANAIPEAGPYRASWASKRCDRALQYLMLGVPDSNPNTFSGFWSMKLGTDVHTTIQKVMRHMGDGWIPEINVDLNPIGIAGSAHADLVRFVNGSGIPYELVDTITWHEDSTLEEGEVRWLYEAGNDKVALLTGEYDDTCMFATHCAEIKSINGFGYKQAASTQNGPPEGPRTGAMIQGALSAAALGLDTVIIVNASLEAANARWVKDDLQSVLAEWEIPGVQRIARYEAGRVRRVVGAGKQLVSRNLHDQPRVPGGAIITQPSNGKWEIRGDDGKVSQFGTTWHCGYCNHRKQCMADGKGGDGVEIIEKPEPTLEEQLAASLGTTVEEWTPGEPKQDS